MNVHKWCDALQANHLLPEYQDVIDGFTQGFDQGIPQHTIEKKQWFTPDNHKSSLLAKDKIQESIVKELTAGRMKGPFSHQQMEAAYGFFRSNPLGAVVNGDGKIRPINNLSYPRNDPDVKSVNSYVDKQNFKTTWDDFKMVSKFFAEDQRKFEQRISLLETVAIRLGLIMLLKLCDQRGKSLIVWTDNTTTENSINNMKTKDKEANDEWKRIQEILLNESVNLVARRVTSKDNKADALSRGLRSGLPVKYQVIIQVPPDLQDLLAQVVFKI
jgi:hypothetical protein